jgi:hypothetical protein
MNRSEHAMHSILTRRQFLARQGLAAVAWPLPGCGEERGCLPIPPPTSRFL